MPTAIRERVPAPLRLAPPTGYVALDIGVRTLKVVVVERKGTGIALKSARLTAHSSPLNFDDAGQCIDTISNSLDRIWETSGRWLAADAACILPTAAITLRNTRVPPGSAEQMHAIIGSEFAEDSGLEPDQWRLTWWEEAGADRDAEGTPVTAAGVPSRIADRLLELLLSRGLACRLMVAAPQVLARITAMLAPGDLASELAVLDWGHETAVFTLARGGRPVFTRLLRDCGFRRVTDAIARELGLSPQDVPLLLCRDGIADHHSAESASTLGPIDELVDDSLGRLRDELTRTLTHLRRQAAGAMPQQLLICGGGGTLHRVEQRLSACTRLPTSVWSGPSFGSGLGRLAPPACMTAPAAVLSAMRWNS